MKKKKPYFPKPVLKSLANDIKKLVPENEGRMFILEIIEEIPFEARPLIVDSLSAFHDEKLAPFFKLLKKEYKELEAPCNRALEKYRMAGVNINSGEYSPPAFYKAFASISRHTGRITLDVAWKTGGSGVQVECFYLNFGMDGIHSFFVIDDMPVSRYEKERITGADMAEVSLAETCTLVKQAYKFNVRNMNRPALGRYLYQKYLDYQVDLNEEQEKDLARRISAPLTPRQKVNSLFHAVKHLDFDYIRSLFSATGFSVDTFFRCFEDTMKPGTMLMEGQVDKVYGSSHMVTVTAYTITIEESTCYHSQYYLYLFKDKNNAWSITDVKRVSKQALESSSKINPFHTQVFCRVYDIIDLDELFEILEKVDNIREVEELPYGIHLRITCYEDDFNFGISFLTGVVADLIINGNEFVVITSDSATMLEFDELLFVESGCPVIMQGEYQVNLITACRYMGGQYINFEDILINEDDDPAFEDGMRLVSARYVVKDRDQVIKRIKNLGNTIKKEFPGGYQVFYQLESESEEPGLFAEYLLGPNWVTVSTFNESDMSIARRNLEDKMFEFLEFDGMEVRGEGIFDILTTEVKKQCPELEKTLKEIYLNKWYYSRLTTLKGMSPCEASKTEEGNRLLWTMYKNIKQTGDKKYLKGIRYNINLKEYIRKVQQKKE